MSRTSHSAAPLAKQPTAKRPARKALYHPDGDGRVQRCPQERWAVERMATEQAVAEYRRLAADALERARNGACSPLEYHMYRMRMEPATLAQTTGLWRWQVRRHRRHPQLFAALPERLLERYAQALGLSVCAVRQLPSSDGE